MPDGGGEFSFFQGIHVRIDIRIDIPIPIKPVTISGGFDSNETTQADAGDVITSRSRDKLKTLYLNYESAYGHQTWEDGNLAWWTPVHRVKWPFDHVIL